ncbi:MAG: cytochrome c biogenesis protein ResB [Phycisphaerales bacterium]|nr:MAG: cytochrome c biogenesis protein ResB [Phycisphaerales bacterium]
MQSEDITGSRKILQAVGSLWFAAVLLVLLLVAMGGATVFESMRGRDDALRLFYKSSWFELLLVLFGVNVLAALTVRYPYTKRRIGFAVTHISILVVLLGALVTELFAVRGQIVLADGETTDSFRGGGEMLTIKNLTTGKGSAVNVDWTDFDGMAAIDNPPAPPLTLGDLTITVERYLMDSEAVERMVNTNISTRHAVAVALSHGEREDSTWVFANQTARLGPLTVELIVAADETQLADLVEGPSADAPTTVGMITVEVADGTYELEVEACMENHVPIGDTGCSVKVLKYLPHATVTEANELVGVSNEPINPAVEVELIGPAGREIRRAFAKFPEFAGAQGRNKDDDVNVTLSSELQKQPTAPIAVIVGPKGDLYVQFSSAGASGELQAVGSGQPVMTPWAGRVFTILHSYNHARVDLVIDPVTPPREIATPAALVRLRTSKSTGTMWVQKYRRRAVMVDGASCEVTYGDEVVPLGFSLTLRQFRIGNYPGETRPRSFEGHVTITDPAVGREDSRVIGMNNPAKYGGYSLFQSSYRPGGMDSVQTLSILSVSRDPGIPVVFAGYIGTIVGMLIVLGTRFTEQRRHADRAIAQAHG